MAEEFIVKLRCNVTHKKDDVWSYRANRDVYTGTEKSAVQKPEVDHVWEIQAQEKVFNEAPVAVRTREGHNQFKKVNWFHLTRKFTRLRQVFFFLS